MRLEFKASVKIKAPYKGGATVEVVLQCAGPHFDRLHLPTKMYPFLFGWKYEHPIWSEPSTSDLVLTGPNKFFSKKDGEFVSMSLQLDTGGGYMRYENDPDFIAAFTARKADNAKLARLCQLREFPAAYFRCTAIYFFIRSRRQGPTANKLTTKNLSQRCWNHEKWLVTCWVKFDDGTEWLVPLSFLKKIEDEQL